MKTYHNFFRFTLVLFALLLVVPASFASYNTSNSSCNTGLEESPIGVWLYNAEGISEAYRTGVFFIRKENGEYIVDVQLDTGSLSGQDVEITTDMIKFNMNIEGLERVSVVLMVKGNTLEGETSSARGVFKIKGVKKIPPQ